MCSSDITNFEELTKVILKILPKDKTDAIYVFGSYDTEFFDEDSDIDIGWFSHNTSYSDYTLLEELLAEALEREVDLVDAWDTKILIKNEILAGQHLGAGIGYMSAKFCDWFDNNIDDIIEEVRIYKLVMGGNYYAFKLW